MTRPRLRALIAAASSVSLSLLLLAPTGAVAGRADVGSDHFVEITCDFLQNDDGTIFFNAAFSDANGPLASIETYGPGIEPFTEPPTYTTGFDLTTSGSYAGGAFVMDIPVVDGTTGEPAGSATIEATLVVSGPQETINDRFRDGNHSFRSSGWFVPYEIVDGTATLPDGSEFALENGPCFADEVQVRFFGSNPTSFVRRFSFTNMNCPLGDVGHLFVDLDPELGSIFVDAFFFDPAIGASAEVDSAGGVISTPLDFISGETGEPAGTGQLDMTVAATGERVSYTLRGGTASRRVHAEVYDVSGTLTAPGYGSFDLGACVVADQTFKEIERPARAPKPTGKPPANDLPSGAPTVTPGRSLTQNTKNAAMDMEEPFDCLTEVDEGNEFPLPVLKTVWLKVAGRGVPVTIDTKGTGFDTAIAVYTKASDGSYEPLPGACVDDFPLPFGRSLQGKVTFTAAAGTTYYVQIGGFPDDLNWGSLHVRVS